MTRYYIMVRKPDGRVVHLFDQLHGDRSFRFEWRARLYLKVYGSSYPDHGEELFILER